ncbi:MAG: S4 domain-containing protein [Candidatus Poribacteria bacterium]|nr:S4 domain-containing protein [Candidatus Poribacteria bacterium]
MRLDKFLQVSRLVKRRTIANTLCSKGAVSVNGHVAKAGKMLSVGDVIRMPGSPPATAERHPTGIEDVPESEYEVVELPSGNVSRARATTLYRQINP